MCVASNLEHLRAKRKKCAAYPGENSERNLLEFYFFFFRRLGRERHNERKKEESKRLPFFYLASLLEASERRNNIWLANPKERNFIAATRSRIECGLNTRGNDRKQPETNLDIYSTCCRLRWVPHWPPLCVHLCCVVGLCWMEYFCWMNVLLRVDFFLFWSQALGWFQARGSLPSSRQGTDNVVQSFPLTTIVSRWPDHQVRVSRESGRGRTSHHPPNTSTSP